MVWYFVPLYKPLGLVISFVLRYVVLNIDYIVYFAIYHLMCENLS
jgi:hypothetical protein